MQVLNVGSLNLNDSRVLEISIRSGEVCFCVDYIGGCAIISTWR